FPNSGQRSASRYLVPMSSPPMMCCSSRAGQTHEAPIQAYLTTSSTNFRSQTTCTIGCCSYGTDSSSAYPSMILIAHAKNARLIGTLLDGWGASPRAEERQALEKARFDDYLILKRAATSRPSGE